MNVKRIAFAAAMCAGVVGDVHAQAGLVQLDDASIVPRGMFRLRAASVWSRFDSRHGESGTTPLGAPFTASALGSAQIAALAPIDSLVSSAIAQPFTLSLGQSRLDARGRHEVVPISLEYGITDRISVGVMVPVVRKRVATQFRLDSAGANVGPNLHRTLASAVTTNGLVQTQFANAASQLQTRLASCQSNPGGAGCPALLARESEATQLIAESQGFASNIAALFGSASSDGLAFVPTQSSGANTEIGLRVADFNTRYRDLLASGSDLLTALPFAAPGPAGSAELQAFLTDELDGDSLATSERSGVGDVELGVRALLWDRVATETSLLAARLVGVAGYRFSTSSQLSSSPIYDLRLGDARDMLDARLALDVQAGRLGLLSGVETAIAIGDADTGTDARWVAVHAAPRFHLSAPLAIHAAYSLRSADVSGAAQFIGGGVSFVSPGGYRAGGALPLEMRYTHLESISGPVGAPRWTRDQIEVRLYFSLFGRD